MRRVRVEAFRNDELLYRFANEAGVRGRAPAEWSVLESQVEQIDAAGNPRVTFAGSDPLEHEEFPRLVELCRSRGLGRFRLVTDGFGLAHAPVIEFLRENDFAEVVVVFPSSNSRMYAAAMRTRSRFEPCVDGLRRAVDSSLETHVVIPLTRLAEHSADETLTWLRGVDVAGVLVELPDFARVAGSSSRYLLPYPDAARLVAKIFRSNRTSRRVSGVFERWTLPACGAHGALDDYGSLFNQRSRHFRARHEEVLQRVDACERCDLATACGGVDSSYVELFGAEDLRPITLDEANRWYTKPINRPEEIPYTRVSPYDTTEREGARGLLRINGHCNMGCSFCFVDLSHPDVSEERLHGELQRMVEAGVTELVISGGEPTLHPSLPRLIAYAKELRFESVEIQSNGVKLADRIYAREVVEAGLDFACISLHSFDAEESDRITKRPKAFSRTVRAIHNLRELGVWTRIAHVINRLNYRDLPQFVHFIREEFETGMLDVCFAIAQEISGETSTWILPTFTEIRPFVTEALDFCLENNIGFSGLIGQGSYPPCMLNGDLRYYAGSLGEIHRSPNRSSWYKADRCRSCAFDAKCVGVRRSYVEAYGDSELQPFGL